jgi:hypothetical protein
MHGFRTFWLVGVACLLVSLVATAAAGKSPNRKKGPVTEADCEQLVKQLVNPEKPPFKEPYVHDLPKSTDEGELWRKQAKIKAAYDKLSDNIEIALPVLMKHIHDDRFSFVYEELYGTSGGYLKESVGGAFREIIAVHVEVNKEYTTRWNYDGDTPHRPSFILNGCGGFGKWSKTRKGKTLAALQLEAIEWVMKQKKPKYYKSEKDWKTALTWVKDLAEKIQATKKPIKVKYHLRLHSR